MHHNKPNGGYCDRCGAYNTLVQDGYNPSLRVCKKHRLDPVYPDPAPINEDLSVKNARPGEIIVASDFYQGTD